MIRDFAVGDLYVDEARRDVYVRGRRIMPPLSRTQYGIVLALYLAGGALVSRQEMVEQVWRDENGDGISEASLDAAMNRMRRRIGHGIVETVRGHGWRIAQDFQED